MKVVKRKTVAITQNSAELRKRIGKKLMRKRKELGYGNSDDFTYETGINRSQYGKYEAGSKDMRFSTLVRIVNAMGMTIEEFFGEGLDAR